MSKNDKLTSLDNFEKAKQEKFKNRFEKAKDLAKKTGDATVDIAKDTGKELAKVGIESGKNKIDQKLQNNFETYKAVRKLQKNKKKIKKYAKNVKKVSRNIFSFVRWCLAAGPIGWIVLFACYSILTGIVSASNEIDKTSDRVTGKSHDVLYTGKLSDTNREEILLLMNDCKDSEKKNKVNAGGFIFNEDHVVLQTFGRTAWSTGAGASLYADGIHTGIDVQPVNFRDFASEDVPVFAVTEGEVMAASSTGIGGNYVTVRMSDGKGAYYGHLKKSTVSVGDKIKVGDQIGVLGNTGATTVYHVHFEIQDNPPNLATKDSSEYLGKDHFENGDVIRVNEAGKSKASETRENKKGSGELPPAEGIKPHVEAFRQAIHKEFGVTDIGGYRPGDPEDHGKGLALDVMVPVDSKLGDDIAQYAIDNIEEAGITYVIWKQRFYMPQDNIYGKANTWALMPDRGSVTQNHHDHVHISFSENGGNGKFSKKTKNEKNGRCKDGKKDKSGKKLSGKDNKEKVWNYLMDEGFSPAAAAGIMGNMQQESNFNPDADNGGGAFGLVQWMGDRQSKLRAYAKERDLEVTNLEIQLSFMIKEMKGMSFGGKSYEEFKKMTDPSEAADIFEKTFERSGASQIVQRMKYAEEIYKEYG